MLARLLALDKTGAEPLPTLVIATTDARQRGWSRLLDDVALSEREAPLVAHVATWSELHDGPARVGRALPYSDLIETYVVRRLRVTPLLPRLPGSRIPRPVGSDFESRAPSVCRLLTVKGLDRELLDVVGRHPFLSSDGLATVLGWEVGRLPERLKRMIKLGFVRLEETGEVRSPAHHELIELTVDGVGLVAAQQGLSVAQAVRYNGLAAAVPSKTSAHAIYCSGISSTPSAPTPCSSSYIDVLARQPRLREETPSWSGGVLPPVVDGLQSARELPPQPERRSDTVATRNTVWRWNDMRDQRRNRKAPLEQFQETWLLWGNFAPKARTWYQEVFTTFLAWVREQGHEGVLGELDPLLVRKWQYSLEEAGRSVNTVRGYVTVQTDEFGVTVQTGRA